MLETGQVFLKHYSTWSSQKPSVMAINIALTLQMMKLQLREFTSPAASHTGSEQWGRICSQI